MIVDVSFDSLIENGADYAALAAAGVKMVSEPAERAVGDAVQLRAYLETLTVAERKRAQRAGVRHDAWVALPDTPAGDELWADLPRYLSRPGVRGIGALTLEESTPRARRNFQRHVQLAIDVFQANDSGLSCAAGRHHLMLIRTPGGAGMQRVLNLLRDFGAALDPARILIEGVDQATAPVVRAEGYWVGVASCELGPKQAADLAQQGDERLLICSGFTAAGFTGVIETRRLLERRGWTPAQLERLFVHKPCEFLGMMIDQI